MELIGPVEVWTRAVKVMGLMGAEVIGGKICGACERKGRLGRV